MKKNPETNECFSKPMNLENQNLKVTQNQQKRNK